ncbi:hypothetical protein [Halorubrum sp. BOL3-1]|uniref:hypothetical protein n=1 Tax=Halorubrum sp. BOL3-1 TaxID=2497325 RepID=UPI0014099090|nr:hypothetical protein [Halorubrum sp. BOL3-1]
MSTGRKSEAGRAVESASEDQPELAVCESRPGKAVFIESENSDGWIAIDEPVEVTT